MTARWHRRIPGMVVLCAALALPTYAAVPSAAVGRTPPDARPSSVAPSSPTWIVWPRSDGHHQQIHVAQLERGSFLREQSVTSDATQKLLPVLAGSPDELLCAVWVCRQGTRRELWMAETVDGRWSEPQRIETGNPVNMAPSLAADAEGRFMLAWSANDGGDDDVYTCRRTRDGWGAVEPAHAANTVPDILPRVQIAADGRFELSWQRYVEGTGYVTQGSAPAPPAAPPPGLPRDASWRMASDRGSWSSGIRRSASSAPSRSTTLGATQDQVDVVTFGDSITQGYPYVTSPGTGTERGGYQPPLGDILRGDGIPAVVHNYGWGGEDTADGIQRFPLVAAQHPGAWLMLIMEGTNDEWGGMSTSTTIFNLSLMIDMSRRAGIEPVLANLTPASRDQEQDIERSLNPAIQDLATSKGVHLCDQYAAFAGRMSSLSDDGLHPNRAGYDVMAATWRESMGSAPLLPPPVDPSDSFWLLFTPCITPRRP